MVSADNLNLDCLELVFACLAAQDLVRAAPVSRAFYAAAVPQLYRALFVHVGNAKRYPKACCSSAIVYCCSRRPTGAIAV